MAAWSLVRVRSALVRPTLGSDAVSFLSRWDRRADRYWHRASACLGCLLIAQGLGLPGGQQLVAAAIGLTFGGGRLSPDVDQLWADMGRQRADDPKMLDHHGITHCPWPPLAVAAALAALALLWPALVVMVFAPLAWVIHDLGDVLIGRGGNEINAGVPITGLWWGHVGLGVFRSGGAVARLLTVVCWLAIPWVATT